VTMWRRLGALTAAGESPLLGARIMARALGAVGLSACALTLLWILLPHPPGLDKRVLATAGVLGLGLSGLLITGRLDRMPPRILHALVATGYMLAWVGTFSSESSVGFFYLWVIPFAYLCFTLWLAIAHTALMSAGYATAVAVQEIGNMPSESVVARGALLFGTALVVGSLVRSLAVGLRTGSERFRGSFRDAATAMAIADLDGRLLDVNDAYCSLLGRPREHLVGTSLVRGGCEPPWSRETLNRRGRLTVELRTQRPDGHPVHVRIEATRIDDSGEPYSFALIHDLAASEAAKTLQERHARQQASIAHLGRFALGELELEALFDHVTDVVHDTLEADMTALCRFDAVEEKAETVAGAGWGDSAERWAVVAPGTLLHAALRADGAVTYDRAAADAPRIPVAAANHDAVSGIAMAVPGPDGVWGFLCVHACSARPFEADEREFIAAVSNVLSSAVERFSAEERMRHLALHDPLTGLPNRDLAADRLAVALSRRGRRPGQVAVLLMDLDDFKVVNDSLGHAAGDKLLTTVAPRLQAALRPEDTVARIGGDEFLIVCDGADSARTPSMLAERVLHAAREPVMLESGERFVTASIGIAVADRADADADALLRDADAALYRAKELGRNRYELFDESLRKRAMTRLQVESELRRALDNGELRVFYQPIVDLATRRALGVEALVRWQHPERGLLEPVEFVPLAEETGLVTRLGDQVLRRACVDVAGWQQRFGIPLTVTVNVSGRQLSEGGFEQRAARAVSASALRYGSLRLEITETVLVGEAESAAPALEELHDLGIGIVLDDFGTGYSSLNYLKRFRVDALKIDRVFVADMVTDDGDRAIVDAVLRMSESLGIGVVAEGVEREDQLAALRELGCPTAQGHLFSRALDAATCAEYLRRELAADDAGKRSPLAA